MSPMKEKKTPLTVIAMLLVSAVLLAVCVLYLSIYKAS